MFRANPNIQIASIMAHFQCDLPTMTCKTQSESQNSTGEQVPFEKPWRSHSTAICTDCRTQKNCNTLLWNTSLAQSVSTHAKHKSTASTKKRKSHLEPSVTLRRQFGIVRAGIDGKALTPETVAHASQLFSAAEPPFNRKNT